MSESCISLPSTVQDPTYDSPSTVLELINDPRSAARDPAYDCPLTVPDLTCDWPSIASSPTQDCTSTLPYQRMTVHTLYQILFITDHPLNKILLMVPYQPHKLVNVISTPLYHILSACLQEM
jgi:hypothetical protein